jgi:hypothetical protein
MFESLFGLELPSTDLDEGRHARWIDSETVSDEVVVSPQLPQTQSDPISTRQVTEIRGLHSFKLAENDAGTLSSGY